MGGNTRRVVGTALHSSLWLGFLFGGGNLGGGIWEVGKEKNYADWEGIQVIGKIEFFV